MAEYIPMTGPLPGERYMPSNGTAGEGFIEAWCCNCARDKPMSEGKDFDECTDDEVCEILAASFRDEAVEWRRLDNGELVCLAFVQAGTEVAPPRCEHTVDMFGEQPKEPTA